MLKWKKIEMCIQGDFNVTILSSLKWIIFLSLMFTPTLLVFLYVILKINEKNKNLCIK